MKLNIRSTFVAVGITGALLAGVHGARAGQAFFLSAPGSQTKTDVNGAASVTATETLAATGATLNITANVGQYLSRQSTLFSNGTTASTLKQNQTNTTDGDIVHLAPRGTTATQVTANIQANFLAR